MQHVGKTGLRAWFARWTTHEHAPLLDPDLFYFYEHNPPTAHLKEDFARVILHFENGEYRNPEWVHFKTVPAVIESARDYLHELDDAGRPAHQHRIIDGH